MRIGFGFDRFRRFRRGLCPRRHSGLRGGFLLGAGFLRRHRFFGRRRRGRRGGRLVRYGHGLDHCGRLTGSDLTLFRCDVALLRGLSAASCQSKYQRGGAR
ncbi:hypothetical protein ATE72_02060 [Sphingopyxis sp. HXXIV]|nr:hypothetical protein ATE72_02060 [Sphingopyxis sp. HXXIV]